MTLQGCLECSKTWFQVGNNSHCGSSCCPVVQFMTFLSEFVQLHASSAIWSDLPAALLAPPRKQESRRMILAPVCKKGAVAHHGGSLPACCRQKRPELMGNSDAHRRAKALVRGSSGTSP